MKKENRIVIARAISVLVDAQPALAAFSAACEAVLDTLVELQNGDVSEETIARGCEAMAAADKFDFTRINEALTALPPALADHLGIALGG